MACGRWAWPRSLASLLGGGLGIRDASVEANSRDERLGLVQDCSRPTRRTCPRIVQGLARYRRWADPELRRTSQEDQPIPGQSARQPRLAARRPKPRPRISYDRLLTASPADLPVIWGS